MRVKVDPLHCEVTVSDIDREHASRYSIIGSHSAPTFFKLTSDDREWLVGSKYLSEIGGHDTSVLQMAQSMRNSIDHCLLRRPFPEGVEEDLAALDACSIAVETLVARIAEAMAVDLLVRYPEKAPKTKPA